MEKSLNIIDFYQLLYIYLEYYSWNINFKNYK